MERSNDLGAEGSLTSSARPDKPGPSYARISGWYIICLGLLNAASSAVRGLLNDNVSVDIKFFLICLLLGIGVHNKIPAFRTLAIALGILMCFVSLVGLLEAVFGTFGSRFLPMFLCAVGIVVYGVPVYMLLDPRAKAEFEKGLPTDPSGPRSS
jgi:hypothetical protein